MKTPVYLDYEFRHGFDGTVSQPGMGFAGTDNTEHFCLSDRNPRPAETILEGRTERFRTIGGGTLTATLFQEGKPELMFIHPGWMGDGEHALSKLQVSLLAQQNPDSSFAYVNMPGARGSEALPRSVVSEMKRSGSFEAYGEELAKMLYVLRQDYEASKGVGWSTGSRAMLGILAARHNEAGLDSVVALDPPGSVHLGRVGIAKAFIVTEGGHGKLYTPDAQTTQAKKIGAPKSPLDLAAARQRLYDFPIVMSRQGLESDLEKAVVGLGKSNTISIISPELSALNDPRLMREILRRVSLGTDAKLLHYVISGQSHTGIMDQNAPLFARLITDTL